jgi:hypothetical protein
MLGSVFTCAARCALSRRAGLGKGGASRRARAAACLEEVHLQRLVNHEVKAKQLEAVRQREEARRRPARRRKHLEYEERDAACPIGTG